MRPVVRSSRNNAETSVCEFLKLSNHGTLGSTQRGGNSWHPELPAIYGGLCVFGCCGGNIQV